MNAFRPHLARAGLLAALWKLEQLRVLAEALAILGLPAAIISLSGRVLASNSLFETMTSHIVWLPGTKVAFTDRTATSMLNRCIADLGTPAAPTVRSFPVRGEDGKGSVCQDWYESAVTNCFVASWITEFSDIRRQPVLRHVQI